VFRGEGTGLYQRFAWNTGRLISRILAVPVFRLRVSGQAHLPKTGGVLMVTNHQSFLDPWLVGVGIPRQVHSMARDSLYKGGFLHYLMELWNAFPVKRGSADLGAIRTAVDRLDKGFLVNIFPEGTRSEDGTIGTIAPGVSLILNRCKTDVPVVPVVIDGAFEAWPRGAKFPRPRQIRIHYGRPIPAAGPGGWREMSAEALAMRMRGELVKLQKERGSIHAAASEKRLLEDQAKAALEPVKQRRRR
jgi:1-acyl-sn-glycerol-3-phosphate acyltransferase